MRPLRLCGEIFLLLAAYVFPQKTADFIILSNPGGYTILNQYQQPLSDDEKRLFVENTPILVENENELLGDQITRALRFGFEGNTWFMQKDEAGNLLGDKGKQYRPEYRKCSIVGDTVLIIEGAAVPFSKRFPPERTDFIGKGETVMRVFSYSSFCYIKRGGARAEYGWASFARKSAWKAVERAEEKPAGITGVLSEAILGRFAEANKTYREYFDHFNTLTHQEKTVPVWRCEALGNEVRCMLNEPYRHTAQMDESTQYLVRDVENMLIGKQCEVVAGKGEIIVRTKAGNGAKR